MLIKRLTFFQWFKMKMEGRLSGLLVTSGHLFYCLFAVKAFLAIDGIKKAPKWGFVIFFRVMNYNPVTSISIRRFASTCQSTMGSGYSINLLPMPFTVNLSSVMPWATRYSFTA
jgi:hypothetical protein